MSGEEVSWRGWLLAGVWKNGLSSVGEPVKSADKSAWCRRCFCWGGGEMGAVDGDWCASSDATCSTTSKKSPLESFRMDTTAITSERGWGLKPDVPEQDRSSMPETIGCRMLSPVGMEVFWVSFALLCEEVSPAKSVCCCCSGVDPFCTPK